MTISSFPESENLRLRQYQTDGVFFLLSHRRGVLALAPGTGKTPTSLVALRDAGARRILVVAPKSVCLHWLDMANQWWPELTGILGTGSQRQRERWRELFESDAQRGPVTLVVNYEAMRIDIEALSALGFDAVVFDEAHRLKNRNAQQTRAANYICKHPNQWVWLITGTPILNRPEEIWSLLHLIDKHRFSSYWKWVEAHCELEPVYRGGRIMSGPGGGPVRTIIDYLDGAIERMRSDLIDVMFSRTLEECLPDLPEVTYVTIDVLLDADERRLYDELYKKVWAEVAPGEILLIPNDVARQTRLRQLVSDIEILGAQRTRPGSKIAAAVELIGDLEPEQVVVLTWSRAAAERVAGEVGYDQAAFIHGGVPTDERQISLNEFKAGTLRVLTGTLATLGEGVDGLQVARHLIRLDRDWTPARNSQSVARIRRSGQMSDRICCWDIVAYDTIDAVVERALRNKESVIEAVLGNLM